MSCQIQLTVGDQTLRVSLSAAPSLTFQAGQSVISVAQPCGTTRIQDEPNTLTLTPGLPSLTLSRSAQSIELRTSLGAAGPAALYVNATCLAGDLVGNCVYFSAPSVNGVYTATTVDATQFAHMPAAGVLISKAGDTSCIVQLFGTTNIYVGLTPGKRYFVGATGTPALPTSVAPGYWQAIGLALDATTMLIQPAPLLARTYA